MQGHFKLLMKKLMYKSLKHDRILFESYPDFTDNTRYVFDEMIRMGLNRKYKFVWVMQDNDPERCPTDSNVFYISMHDRKQYAYNVKRAIAIVSCNRMLASYVPEQFSIYLTHGIPFKLATRYLHAPQNACIRYSLSSSPLTEKLQRQYLMLSPDTEIVSLGYPRNDVFFKPKRALVNLFTKEYSKVIAWYPTFRNHKYETRNEGDESLPIIHDENKAIQLNNVAKEQNVLIVIKPHPVQDVNYIKRMQLSNIMLIDDSFFDAHCITNYEFLNSCDALLSDYSSVFLDYLLTNNPIGLIWEDIEKYKKDLGLVESYQELSSGCEKIYSLEDLISFINEIASDIDRNKTERLRVSNSIHLDADGKSAKKVARFIAKKARL